MCLPLIIFMKRHPILYTVLILIGLSVVLPFLLKLFGWGPKPAPVQVVLIENAIIESTEKLKELKEIEEDSNIKAIVLRIDSPGGGVAASQEIYEEVKKLKEKKIVVVSMGSVAASGGYYIACPAHKIVANPGTITGSIGVIMRNFGMEELVKLAKLENRTLSVGKYKEIGSPYKPETPEEKAFLQNILDNMYKQFITAVSTGRNIPIEKMKDVAEGRIYTGEQAMAVGLVDQLGNIYDAIDLAKNLAKLPADAKVAWPKKPTFWEKMAESKLDLSFITELLQKTKSNTPIGYYLLEGF